MEMTQTERSAAEAELRKAILLGEAITETVKHRSMQTGRRLHESILPVMPPRAAMMQIVKSSVPKLYSLMDEEPPTGDELTMVTVVAIYMLCVGGALSEKGDLDLDDIELPGGDLLESLLAEMNTMLKKEEANG